MAFLTTARFCVCAFALAVPVAGNTFLAARDLPSLLEEGDGDLLADLSTILSERRAADVRGRADALEAQIRPTFKALPQSRDGRVDSAGVRYLLHRVFVERHGWFVEGLHSAGDSWNSSSPTAFLRDVDGALEQRVDSKLSKRGFTLSQVAVLAATLESLVHMESVERLHSAYRVADLDIDVDASEAQIRDVMEIYMQGYVLGVNHGTHTRERHEKMLTKIREVYPNWDATMQWVMEIREEVVQRSGAPATSFSTTLLVLEEMSERYGRWQHKECLDIKQSLMKLEDGSSGRVRLSEFYGSALEGNWQFSESKEYLRQLGALDEENPRRPSVIIPNYVNSPSNCVASSEFYSVCCIDECEALMGHIEAKVAAPQASADQLAAIVRDLPSSSVAAPRDVSPTLRSRLDDIAATHDGSVPLHGRLFAQWLHHAYPRECPYPHLSGTSQPTTIIDWMKKSGGNAVADEDTMKWHVQEAKLFEAEQELPSELPWSSEEELFVSHPAALGPQAAAGPHSLLRSLAMVIAACSMAWVVVQVAFATDGQVAKSSTAKYAV